MDKIKDEVVNYFKKGIDTLKDSVKTWGNHNFKFILQTQTNYEYLASNLVAEAFEQNRVNGKLNYENWSYVPIAIQWTWKRVKGKRIYKIDEIKGNTYPLSADDVGWIIRVEAAAIEDNYEGTAYAEFGPVTVEPATKKSLEYILASGSSQFPVTIFYPGDRNNLPEEREWDEGKLIVYVDKVELIKKNKKTTIISPWVGVSQVDSQMLHLSYFDKEEGYLGDKEYTHSLDIRALTRKSRDLIVLSLRCFSALNSYKNSKVIEMLNIEEEKPDFNKLQINSISDLLIEQDSIKRELYEQININKRIKHEKDKCFKEYKDLEIQMNHTIESYQSVIELQQMESNGDSFQYKKQLVQEQNVNERLQVEISGLNERILLANDENKTLMKNNETLENAVAKLNKKVHKYKNQNGVPHSQVKKLEDAIEKSHEEIESLKAMLAKYDRAAKSDKAKIKQLEQQISNLNYWLGDKKTEEDQYKQNLESRNKNEK